MWHLYRCLYDVPISLYCHRTWAPILKQIRSVIQNGQIPAENWNSEHECQREPHLCFVSVIFRRPAGLSGTVLLKMNPPLLCSQPQRVCGASAVVLAVTWHGTDWRQREAASVITVFKDIFKKSPSLLDPPGALALFCFLFFFPLEFFLMLPSVALWKRAPWKPPPTTSRTAEPCSPARRGSFTPPARQWLKGCIFNSAELKERSQLCFSLSLSLFFSCLFVSISVLPPPSSSHPPPPCCMVCFSDLSFIFHGFLGSTRSAVFKVFHFWERSAVWAESSAVMWFCGLYSRSLRTLPHRVASFSHSRKKQSFHLFFQVFQP